MAESKKLTGIKSGAYRGVEPATPFDFTIETRTPTTDDYENFNVGHIWLYRPDDTVDPNTHVPYMLARKEALQATWITFGGGGLLTLTGDTGLAVPSSGSGVINVVSGFSALSFDGNPMTNTILLNDNGSIPISFPTDSGTGTASGNALNINGGTGIDTSASGSTITVSVDGTVAIDYISDSGTATAINNEINIVGGTGIDTTASGNTITISVSGNVLKQINTDSGSATPVAGVIQVLGGLNIDTAGSGNTVTIKTPTLAEGVVYINGSGVFTSLGTADDGELLIGATGSTPDWANITSTGGSVTITNGPNTINLEVSSSTTDIAFFAYLSSDINLNGFQYPYYFVCDTEDYDIGSDYNAATGIFTAPSDGLYFFGAACQMVITDGDAEQFWPIILGFDVDNIFYEIDQVSNIPPHRMKQTSNNIGTILKLTTDQDVRPYFGHTAFSDPYNYTIKGIVSTNEYRTYFFGRKIGDV